MGNAQETVPNAVAANTRLSKLNTQLAGSEVEVTGLRPALFRLACNAIGRQDISGQCSVRLCCHMNKEIDRQTDRQTDR